MSQERPGDSSHDSDEVLRGPHSAEPPPARRSDAGEGGFSPGHSGFTVQPGGRNPMADTAERLGRAAGTAGRQMRRRLELVRPAVSKGSNALVEQQDEVAHPFGELGEFAAGRVQLLQDALASSRRATRRLVTEHPGPALAALAGICVALGVGLRWSGSRRR